MGMALERTRLVDGHQKKCLRMPAQHPLAPSSSRAITITTNPTSTSSTNIVVSILPDPAALALAHIARPQQRMQQTAAVMLVAGSTVVGTDPIPGISNIHLGANTIHQHTLQVPSTVLLLGMLLGMRTQGRTMRWLQVHMNVR